MFPVSRSTGALKLFVTVSVAVAVSVERNVVFLKAQQLTVTPLAVASELGSAKLNPPVQKTIGKKEIVKALIALFAASLMNQKGSGCSICDLQQSAPELRKP